MKVIVFLHENHIKMHLISCLVHIETEMNLQLINYITTSLIAVMCQQVLVEHINPLYLTPKNTTTAIHEPEPNVSRTKMSDPVQSGPGISSNKWNFRTGIEPNFLKILGPRRTGTKKDLKAVR